MLKTMALQFVMSDRAHRTRQESQRERIHRVAEWLLRTAPVGLDPFFVAAWKAARPAAIERVVEAVQGLTGGEMTVSRLSVAAGLLSDLARSA